MLMNALVAIRAVLTDKELCGCPDRTLGHISSSVHKCKYDAACRKAARVLSLRDDDLVHLGRFFHRALIVVPEPAASLPVHVAVSLPAPIPDSGASAPIVPEQLFVSRSVKTDDLVPATDDPTYLDDDAVGSAISEFGVDSEPDDADAAESKPLLAQSDPDTSELDTIADSLTAFLAEKRARAAEVEHDLSVLLARLAAGPVPPPLPPKPRAASVHARDLCCVRDCREGPAHHEAAMHSCRYGADCRRLARVAGVKVADVLHCMRYAHSEMLARIEALLRAAQPRAAAAAAASIS
jgi:hypothetical protein